MAANSLQAVLDRARVAAPEEKPARAPARAAKPKATPAAVERAAPKGNPGRRATKLIGGHYAPEVSTQLRIIAAEEGSTVQSLLAEAIDDLFVKKGKARLAQS